MVLLTSVLVSSSAALVAFHGNLGRDSGQFENSVDVESLSNRELDVRFASTL